MTAVESRLSQFAADTFENHLVSVRDVYGVYWVMRQRDSEHAGVVRPLRPIGNVGHPEKYLREAIAAYAAES